jgi:hypothetical protein
MSKRKNKIKRWSNIWKYMSIINKTIEFDYCSWSNMLTIIIDITLLKWAHLRFYIETMMFQNEKIKFKKILKRMCQRHELESKKSRSSEINYINVWKRREVIKLNIMMKSTLFESSTLKIRFYWISKTFIFLNRQRNLITSITNRLRSKNSLKSKFINCDYFIRFEYIMCFMFLCWNRIKNDSKMK